MASLYRWVRNPDDINAPRLFGVGINDDGTLRNPHGYPDELVRRAVTVADQHCYERRSKAAKKAAVTRARRTEQKVHAAAKRILEGYGIGPQHRCAICRKSLSDRESIERGIGSECWQDVLRAIAKT